MLSDLQNIPARLRCALIIGIAVFQFAVMPTRAMASPDTARFNRLLEVGNSVYSRKQGYASFQQSLRYFDSAQRLAEESGDLYMRASAVFARGRIYDAWNQEPAKTIELFTQATRLFRQLGDEPRYFYAKHLIAHAYDKVRDSVHATAILRELFHELAGRDAAIRRRTTFIPEMALIATEVRAYPLADSILSLLTQRSWIVNDPQTYNYLDHYYLTRSRLDVYWHRNAASPYPDSLALAYSKLTAFSDRLYYTQQLAELYGTTGNYGEAYAYMKAHQALQDQLFAGNAFEKMQRALIESETASERRKLDYEAAITRSRVYAIWALSMLAAVIAVLSGYLYRRNKKYRAQSIHLQHVNEQLDTQVAKVELLNKEMQHRIKNNLYTIYSLLHMQEQSTDNEVAIAHLGAARLRVESVAALHNQLSAGQDAVDFGAHIKFLINNAVSCLADRRKVVTHITSDSVSVPLTTCSALSLILNEWITNSIKYARVSGDTLSLDVEITTSGNQLCIDYADNGVADRLAVRGEGLGMDIIRLLTAQIKGKLTTDPLRPYNYQLCLHNE